MNRPETFEQACAITGDNPTDERFTTGPVDEIAHRKLKVIAAAINGNWKADWNNKQRKYFALFYSNGSRLVFSYVNLWCAFASVSSRLCFHNEEDAKYFGTQFIDLHNDFLNS